MIKRCFAVATACCVVVGAFPLYANAVEFEYGGALNVSFDRVESHDGETESSVEDNGSSLELGLAFGEKVSVSLEWDLGLFGGGGFEPSNQLVKLDLTERMEHVDPRFTANVYAGRGDTAFNRAKGGFDLFADGPGDSGNAISGDGQYSDTVGVRVEVKRFVVESSAIMFDPEEPSEERMSGSSTLIGYQAPSLQLSLGYDREVLHEIESYDDEQFVDAARLVLVKNFSQARIGALYQRTQLYGSDVELESYALNGGWLLAPSLLLKVQLAETEDLAAQWSVGADFGYSNSILYTDFTRVEDGPETLNLGMRMEF